MDNKIFVWPGNSNDQFQCSTFHGEREIAIQTGYVEISIEDYKKLRKKELKWNDNKELIEV